MEYGLRDPERLLFVINSLAGTLQSLDLSELATQHEQGKSQKLLDSLNAWAAAIAAISNDVTSRYFSHNVPRVS